uniref:LRRCT domain-containing protein n=1 Tax=Branchiostoma floridae TaxID=7739 RepID=C3Z0I9_BRAFL|eukprot:XP_002598025.1 hypothetical protein BRAFLDRAFT_79749 [Branchiostoma floridae]
MRTNNRRRLIHRRDAAPPPHKAVVDGRGDRLSRKPNHRPNRQDDACILCPAQLQQQPVLNVKNSSQPTSTCLPNKGHVAVRGFSFGILSVQKLRPPQQSETYDLALIQCGITDLEQGILAEFPKLASLQLDFNNLTHVKGAWFDGLKFPALFWALSLSHNRISNMESNCFQNLSYLLILKLDNNVLQVIQPSWFHNLKMLGSLSLKSNSIETIPPQTFKSLPLLSDLDLSRNKLTCLSRETVEGLHKLGRLSLGGNRLLALDDSVNLVMSWKLYYRYPPFDGQRVAVRVNEALFCITELNQLRQFYHVQMQHDIHTQAARPGVEPNTQCTYLNSILELEAASQYSLPLVIVSFNTTSDKHARNIAHLCKRAWEDVSTVKVALRGDITLQIVPMGVDRSCNPQIVAIVLSNAISNESNTKLYADRHSNNVSAFGHEEMKNVTCLVNTWEETYQHVFTTPLSSTPDDTVCAENTQATRTVSSTPDGTGEGMPLTTRGPEIMTTKSTLNRTDISTDGTVKEKSPRNAIITMVTIVAVVLVALFVTYNIRRQRCCSRGHLAGAQGTAPDRTAHQSSSSGDDPQYSEIPDEYFDRQSTTASTTRQTANDYNQIPDEYFNYYNTRPGAENPYWQIPDEYYNRYNTYPPRRRVPQADVVLPSSTRLRGKHPSYDTAPQVWRDPQNYQIPARGRRTNIRSHDNSGQRYMGLTGNHRLSYPQDNVDYSVRLNTAAAEVVLPSSTRLGGKHPSYDTAPQVWRDPQNYQIPARGRRTNIRSHDNSGQRYMGLTGNHRLSYPQDNVDYSVRFNTAAVEVVLPSSTRLGGKHPSYDTAPQVWRDPQNYQIPARGRRTNIRSHGMHQTDNSGHRYMGLIGNHRLSYPLTLRVPQDDRDYSVRFNTVAAEVVLPSSTRLGGQHPSYDTAPQVWRDPQNYQIPARGRRTNIRSNETSQSDNTGHRYMGLTGKHGYSRRPLSYPSTPRVPHDDRDYSVSFNTAAAEVVLPSSTRLGCKHPSYDTAPQVWRDPQNYQIPARGRNTNIRPHGAPVARSSSVPRYMTLTGN